MTSLTCFVAISGNFGDAPIVAQLKEGKRIFEQGKGIDRTEQDARIVVGKWFDGEHIQPVEEVIFVTPGLLSRWLGYQQYAGTPYDEIKSSWKQCSSQFSTKSIALIRLARLCTVDMVDGDVDNSAKPSALDSIKIQMHQVNKPWQEIPFRTVQDIQRRRPEEVLKETWDQILAKFTAWPSKATENELIPEIKWGLNRRVSLIADTPTLDAGSKCELKIIEKDRTRVIPFNYPKS